MRIAICDDEAVCRDQVISVARAYAEAHPERNVSFTAFEWTEDLLAAAGKIGGFDVYILDIVMQRDLNGIQLGQKLREAGYDGKIIYLTSSEEYAIDSFKVKAFHYIMKPIEQTVLFSVLDEAYDAISVQKNRSIIVKTKQNSVKLQFDSILYAVLTKRAIVYHLVGGNTVECTTLRTTFTEAVSPLLEDSRFVLCGAGMVANMHHITMVESDALVFRDKHRAYLGKKACQEIRAAWNDFWFNGEGSR